MRGGAPHRHPVNAGNRPPTRRVASSPPFNLYRACVRRSCPFDGSSRRLTVAPHLPARQYDRKKNGPPDVHDTRQTINESWTTTVLAKA